MPNTRQRKKPSKRVRQFNVAQDEQWNIIGGKLTRSVGNPGRVQPLFRVVGEKIPLRFLRKVRNHLRARKLPIVGVYIAHDSMGYPRYIGRGSIFSRLGRHRRKYALELTYFSFFVVADKVHEREIETIMIRAAGPLLDFNDKKVRNDIRAGNVRDFEPGTRFVQRLYRARPAVKKRRRRSPKSR